MTTREFPLGQVRISPKGNYDPQMNYNILDVVFNQYDGNSYIAIKPSTNQKPSIDSKFWMILSKGSTVKPELTDDGILTWPSSSSGV